jgi:hypothetical protein
LSRPSPTELGSAAGLHDEFKKRNAKVIGLSVASVTNHSQWAIDIEEVGGRKVNYRHNIRRSIPTHLLTQSECKRSGSPLHLFSRGWEVSAFNEQPWRFVLRRKAFPVTWP